MFSVVVRLGWNVGIRNDDMRREEKQTTRRIKYFIQVYRKEEVDDTMKSWSRSDYKLASYLTIGYSLRSCEWCEREIEYFHAIFSHHHDVTHQRSARCKNGLSTLSTQFLSSKPVKTTISKLCVIQIISVGVLGAGRVDSSCLLSSTTSGNISRYLIWA